MIVLRELAPAKINLYLHVLGKRPDGYHLLDSLIAFTDVADKLEVIPAGSITVDIKGPFAALVPKEDNSVLQAAEALQKHSGVKLGASLTLHKNLPVGAGIGGGSADAAATFKLLTRFWKIKPAAPELHKMAMALGADVPACLRGVALYASGIGEALEPGPVLSGTHIVLVNHGQPLLTQKVFAAHKAAFSTPPRHPSSFASNEAFVQFLQKTKNDLQPTAAALMPEITKVLEALGEQKSCQFTRMSGSGATCFAGFADQLSAQNAAQQLSERHPTWWVKAATIQ